MTDEPPEKMRVSAQPLINLTNCRRRFFETYSPTAGCRLFIKRSATREEANQRLNLAGAPADALIQRSYTSLQNEALALHWIKTNTNIPVPNVFAAYEDRGCFYLIHQYVEDCIPAFDADKRLEPYIAKQLDGFLQELHRCRSKTIHSFTEQLHLPARMAFTKTYLSHLKYPEDPERERYVLCHGDLGWQNVMVNPVSGKIEAIIDWEFAGFWPVEIEGEYWRRRGTASAHPSELNDVDMIANLLYNLSKKGHFDDSYKSPHAEDMERSPFSERMLLRPVASNPTISESHQHTSHSGGLGGRSHDSHAISPLSITSHPEVSNGDSNDLSYTSQVQNDDGHSESHSVGSVIQQVDHSAPPASTSAGIAHRSPPSLPAMRQDKKSKKRKLPISTLIKRVLSSFKVPGPKSRQDSKARAQKKLSIAESSPIPLPHSLPADSVMHDPIETEEQSTVPEQERSSNLPHETNTHNYLELSPSNINLRTDIPHWTGDTGGDETGGGGPSLEMDSGDVPEWGTIKAEMPPDQPLTTRRLSVQVAVDARKQVGDHVAALRRSAMVDTHATKNWLAAVVHRAPEYYYRDPYGMKRRMLSQESLHLVELSNLLDKPLQTLSDALQESGKALSSFQDAQLRDVAVTAKRIEQNPAFAQVADKRVDYSEMEEAKWDNPLDREGDMIKWTISGDRDEAFSRSETIKWKAIRKAAEDLLLISHVADCLLPFLPDRDKNQKSRFRNHVRAVIEDKARDLILGGTGGWTIRIEEVTDWVPIDHKALGVPEDETKHLDDTISINERSAEQDMALLTAVLKSK
ncbi:uncharacterized protein I303_105227 [Kwoniella dejecticola CBS 10117]|uniref:Aminoglycoside phosphotransferase domain-containing protein n=1 Tax=Kwoniella dejecticola CBS 10117 TaxID=1296121 RepID=A0A1A6A334_9TREE|nr:uncharacterized protein I303_05326 [Kwoniella dejecticola CBS 10117]OBR84468.1 hypothetical protein I303_05326 [Kwoniella dejecticola CBS 10117]